jgi:AraC-like DNA-binding protein
MTLEAMFNEAGKTDLPHKLVNLSLLYHLFAQLAEEVMPRSENVYVAAALYHIAGHYTEDLTVGRLADELHLNENYFSKLFKRETGMTPKQAIVTARLEKAKELLRYTDLPVGDVARSVGIDDPLYFSRAFKRYTGYTPSAYHEYTNV